MTEDEKRQQKAMLLLEYHDAEQNLAHLEAKASSASKRLVAVATWLKSASRRHDSIHDKFYVADMGGEVNVTEEPLIPSSMDFGATVKLIQDIRDGRKTVDELFQRKQSLGLK